MHLALAEQRRAQQQAHQSGARRHSDGHPVAIRALPDYDALFGIDLYDFKPGHPDGLDRGRNEQPMTATMTTTTATRTTPADGLPSMLATWQGCSRPP